MTTPSSEATKLQQILNKLKADMEALKGGAAAPQLDNSAIEVTQGKGYIPILENGVVKHIIGRQPDGTITSVSKNNKTPPIVPNTPTCIAGLGSVSVSCSGFGTAQYADFSHINVYCDGVLTGTLMKVPEQTVIAPLSYGPHSFELTSVNLSGTESAHTQAVLCTPNQVVSADVAHGIITALQLANDAVTAAAIATGAVGNTEIADNSISTAKVIALAIQSAQIAASAISADKIAANAVTSDKIIANAITALQISANAVTAGAIQAGSVDATKLAAQVILASQAIIAGSPTGQRIQMDSSGLFQIDSRGNLALQLGTNPQGNSLSVIDPTDPTNALASIGSDGTMTMSGININGTAQINGVDLVQFLNNTPGGTVAQGLYSATPPTTTSEIGLFEISFTGVAGRNYLILSDPVYAVGFAAGLYARYTTDGTVPTLSSTVLSEVYGQANWVGQTGNQSVFHQHSTPSGVSGTEGFGAGVPTSGQYHNHSMPLINTSFQVSQMFKCTTNSRIRLLLSLVNGDLDAGSVGSLASSNNQGIGFYAIDMGLTSTPIGGSNTGSGSSSATGQYTTVWHPTYTAYYGDTAGNTGSHTDQLKQGKEGSINWMCMLGFDYANIVSVLTGATVTDIKLFLYSDYWALSSGGYACVGLHNATGATPPSSYSFTTRDILDQQMKKPQGAYLDLPNSAGTALKNGTAKGLVLDSRLTYPSTSNLGTFKNKDYTDQTKIPSLTITYTK